jgi:hypothetical protein
MKTAKILVVTVCYFTDKMRDSFLVATFSVSACSFLPPLIGVEETRARPSFCSPCSAAEDTASGHKTSTICRRGAAAWHRGTMGASEDSPKEGLFFLVFWLVGNDCFEIIDGPFCKVGVTVSTKVSSVLRHYFS